MKLISILLILKAFEADSLKVLLYQTLLGRSHIQFSGALVDSLVERGHVVVRLFSSYYCIGFTDRGMEPDGH